MSNRADSHLKILVVEDNPDDAELLELKLGQIEQRALRLVQSRSVKEAIAILVDEQIDLIFLDLGLPDATGVESIIKLTAQVPFTPIIVLTGRTDEAMALESLRRGALDYLIKDEISPGLLARSISYALERKRAGEAFKWLAAVVESSHDAIIGSSTDNLILSWNRGAQEIYGYTAEEMLGKSVELLVPKGEKTDTKEILARVLIGEKVEHWITRRQRKDGKVITVSISASPVRNFYNEIIGVSVFARNVGALMDGQKASQKESQRLASALEIADIGSWDWDLSSDRLSWDDRVFEIFGSEPGGSLSNEHFLSRVLEADRARVRAAMEHSLNTGEPYDIEFSVVWPDDSLRQVVAKARVINGPGGPEQMIGTCIDVTEQRLAQNKHERLALLEEREEFVATLTHDLKNPIIGSTRLLELLAADCETIDKQELKNLLLHIRDSNKMLLLMIQNLTEVYRFDRDANALTLQRIDIVETITECINEIKPLAKSRRIALHQDFPQHIEVNVDRLGLQRVVQNLLCNSLKYTPDEGSIRISIKEEKAQILFEIEDSGSGVSQKDQEHLFQRFGRGSSERKYIPGTGLGLYLCKKIITAHQGTIAYVHREGKGAMFVVTIPKDTVPCRTT